MCTKFDINIDIYYPKYTTGVNCREGNAYSPGALEFTFGFYGSLLLILLFVHVGY